MKHFVFIFLLISNFCAFSQSKKPFVFTYGVDTVYNTEFERVYSKNNDTKKVKPTDKDIKDYLELYIKFKLKVKEAYNLKLDTNEAYIKELAGYRKQLATPYLTDNKVTEQLITEAYNRMQEDVNVSHILILASKDDLPKDTLAAFQKISELRKQITENKISFDSAAFKYSEDPSAKTNYGNLGYFTAFQMIYPFENVAYNTPVSQISQVFRTQYGYHIIKVNNRRPNQGEIRISHIMIRFNNINNKAEIDAAKEKIDAIYKKLQAGENFEELVKQYSEDYTTKANNGEMQWFKSTSQLPQEFKDAAFNLKNIGDYSSPVKTNFGWHIIKKLEIKPNPPLSEQKENIKYKISRDERSQISSKAVLERLKQENKFVHNEKELLNFIKTIDTTIIKGTWVPGATSTTRNVLFTIGNQKYTFIDFSNFVKDYQTPKKSGKPDLIIRDYYNSYVEKMNFAYEEDRLEEKYIDFKYLMQEYRDGILLFELTDKMVWNKSVEDTIGLKNFYEKNKSKYMWKKRADVAIFECSNASVAKKVKKLLKKNPPDSLIYKKINKKDPLALSIVRGKYEEGQNEILNKIDWKEGITDIQNNEQNKFTFVKIYSVIPPVPKELNETMGVVTSDYQSHLEDSWITELKSKYPVIINNDGISKLFKD
ncbi:MAG: peptidylprolyl isomerase [Bacteroidetes bacterium]|nr:peptidylprolyl isomerase [Bacteroidota bacterium]